MRSSAVFALAIYLCGFCPFSAAKGAAETGRGASRGRGESVASRGPQNSVRAADLSVLPQRPHIVRDPEGSETAVYGTLNGEARSAQSVLMAVIAAQGSQSRHGFRFFDDVPNLQVIVADRMDHHVQAMFSALQRRARVLGIVSVSLDGSGSVSLLFDRPDSFSNSLPRLRQAVAQSSGRGPIDIPLYPTRLADGSSISLPQGWNVTAVNKGSMDLSGPRGEEMSLGAAAQVYRYVRRLPYMPANYVLQAPCCDPVRAYAALFPQIAATLTQRLGKPAQFLDRIVEYQPTAWPRGQAAYVLSESRMGGHPRLNYLLVAAIPAYSDPWTLYMSGLSAPTEIFREELPTMLKVWGSYSVNPAIFAERLEHAAQTMRATAEMMRSTIAEKSRAFYSCNEGWDQVIRGVQTIEDTRTGERWKNVDNTRSQWLADRLSTETGHQWVIVPPSRLIPR